jgi:hypothetical protein
MSDEPGFEDIFVMAVMGLVAATVIDTVGLLNALLDSVFLMLRVTFEQLAVLLETFGALGFPMLAVTTIVALAVVVDSLNEVEEDPVLSEVAGLVLEAESEQSETGQTIEAAVEEIQKWYVAGDIDELEMEKQLARALDPEFHELRERLEEVGGIGEDLSESVAIRFDSLEEVRKADSEELRRVSGVGEQRAEAIRERV